MGSPWAYSIPCIVWWPTNRCCSPTAPPLLFTVRWTFCSRQRPKIVSSASLFGHALRLPVSCRIIRTERRIGLRNVEGLVNVGCMENGQVGAMSLETWGSLKFRCSKQWLHEQRTEENWSKSVQRLIECVVKTKYSLTLNFSIFCVIRTADRGPTKRRESYGDGEQ